MSVGVAAVAAAAAAVATAVAAVAIAVTLSRVTDLIVKSSVNFKCYWMVQSNLAEASRKRSPTNYGPDDFSTETLHLELVLADVCRTNTTSVRYQPRV